MHRITIFSDNDEEVLVKLCNLFAARVINIETLHAQPLNLEKTISSIGVTIDIGLRNIANIRENILQIVPVRKVSISEITE